MNDTRESIYFVNYGEPESKMLVLFPIDSRDYVLPEDSLILFFTLLRTFNVFKQCSDEGEKSS